MDSTPNDRTLRGKGPYRDRQSDASKERTTPATSQDELPVPTPDRDDLPEADRKDVHEGVYRGPGTGVAPAHTDTGGADTSRMEEHPRLGTTGETQGPAVAGGSVDRSSEGAEADRSIDAP